MSLSYCNCFYILLFLFACLCTLCSRRFVYNNDINNDYSSASHDGSQSYTQGDKTTRLLNIPFGIRVRLLLKSLVRMQRLKQRNPCAVETCKTSQLSTEMMTCQTSRNVEQHANVNSTDNICNLRGGMIFYAYVSLD